MESQKPVVLYADDDPDDLLLVREAFDQYSESIELITAYDGYEAISCLQDLAKHYRTPCLIILDVNMPRLDGKETLKEIRNLPALQDVPAVLFTTSSLPADKDFALQYRAGFVTKPLDVRQIELIADQFLQYCSDEVKKTIVKKII